MTYWKPKGNDLCFPALTSRVQSVRVWSFIQKCHNRVINKVSTVGQPARARDVGTKMVEGENAERSGKKKKQVTEREEDG